MEFQCLLGLKSKDFVMVAADQMQFTSIIVMKNDHKKIHKISDRIMMGVMGDQADTTQLVQYFTKHMELYRIRNHYSLDTGAAAHFARYNLTGARLSGLSRVLLNAPTQSGMQMPYNVQMLLAGYDDKEGGRLYFLDALGTCTQVPHVALGFGGMISTGILDRYYSPSLTEKEAYKVLTECTKEIHQRLLIQLPKFEVSVVSKEGVKELPPLVFEKFQNLS